MGFENKGFPHVTKMALYYKQKTCGIKELPVDMASPQ
jgi:hypothetical protein